jgi:hypothetical protein
MRLFIVLLVVGSACSERRRPHDHVTPPPSPRSSPVGHKAALAEAIAHPPTFSGAACDVDAPQPPPPLDKLSLSLSPAGDDTYAYLLDYWHVTGSSFEIIDAAHAPIRSMELDAPLVTLVIDHFVEPAVRNARPDGTFPSGELRGRVLVWNGDAIACGAEVTAHNSASLRVPKSEVADGDISFEEDPRAKPRVDLVNEALRAGLAALRKPAG